MSYEQQLKDLVRNEEWLMDVLRAARNCKLDDWFVAAGAIRNTVWDVLHKHESRTSLTDIDLVYFDEKNKNQSRDNELTQKLQEQMPSMEWDVVNQARGYELNGWTPSVSSTCESIAYWSETPTCVGVRLENDDSMSICAPHGLDDLMNLRVRPIPEPYRNIDLYKERIEKKTVAEDVAKTRYTRMNYPATS